MKLTARFDPTDLSRLQAVVAKLAQKKKDGARAMYTVGEVWMTEAKRRTPVRWGFLRGSGHVTQPREIGQYIEVRLVFGGPSAPYAGIVHENLTAYHHVGQAKFLESVVVERKKDLGEALVAEMK